MIRIRILNFIHNIRLFTLIYMLTAANRVPRCWTRSEPGSQCRAVSVHEWASQRNRNTGISAVDAVNLTHICDHGNTLYWLFKPRGFKSQPAPGWGDRAYLRDSIIKGKNPERDFHRISSFFSSALNLLHSRATVMMWASIVHRPSVRPSVKPVFSEIFEWISAKFWEKLPVFKTLFVSFKFFIFYFFRFR